MMHFVSRSEENNVEKGENADNQLSYFGHYNSGLYRKGPRYYGSKVTML